jgi:c(7)-type cytochrome triheme protein
MNRLNVSITGMERSSGVSYAPSLTEVSITLMIVAIGFAVFTLAAKYLPVFQHAHDPEPEPEAEPEWIEPDSARPEPARRPLLGILTAAAGVAALLFLSAIGLTDEAIRSRPETARPAPRKAAEIRKTAALENFRMPADVAFPQAADSPAPVTFRHAVHVDANSPECLSCHGGGQFSFVRGATPRAATAAGAMHKLCGQCHDGTSSFSVEADCEKCHRESPGK